MQTQWFDGNLKPQADGMYKRRFKSGVRYWARFCKGIWYCGDFEFEDAKAETVHSALQNTPMWAGCTETDWIPGNLKPVRDGVYKRQVWVTRGVYAKFKNGKWYMASDRYEDAERCGIPSKCQSLFNWKGIHHEY